MRKTNLFYSQSQDSNFVTFSNYTEALTGNILSTNSKMFPSKFICLYIPTLDNENFNNHKERFITQFLSGYYENKLAVVRDWCLKNNIEKPENILNPLDYLLNAIYMFDYNTDITFIGDICEQDYNGTFMDNICIIENNASSQLYEYKPKQLINNHIDIEADGFLSEKYKSYDDYQHKLYGWAGATKLPSNFEGINAMYDNIEDENDPQFLYYYESESIVQFKHIKNDQDEEVLAPKPSEIKFNVLIPLFDVYQYYQAQTLNVVSEFKYDDKNEQGIDESTGRNLVLVNNSEYKNQYDVPIGMWFTDKPVVLERSEGEGQSKLYRPSWSLCISAQFKPFPYSNTYPNELSEYSNPDKFATFAMIMSKQAFIVDEFNSLSENYANLANQLNDLTVTVRTLQGVEENNLESESGEYDDLSLVGLQTQIQQLQNNLVSQQAQLYLFSNNYIKDSDLEMKAARLGYLTAEGVVDYIGHNYLTTEQINNYISSLGYVKTTEYNTVKNVSNSTFTGKLNEFITASSDLGIRFANLCGGNGGNQTFESSTSQYVREGHTLPEVYNFCHNDLVNGYVSAYSYLLGRLQRIDGIGFETNQGSGVTAQSFIGNVQSAFDKLESTNLPAIKDLFAYLLTRTTLFGGVKWSTSGDTLLGDGEATNHGTITGTDDAHYLEAIGNVLKSSVNWSEIYQPEIIVPEETEPEPDPETEP
jgi:hypothetical protein